MKSFRSFLVEDLHQKIAVKAYIGADTGALNRELRRTDGNHRDEWVDHLDRTMKSSKGSKVLWRGVSSRHGERPHELLHAKVGDVIRDHGYMSTSLSRGTAGMFGGYTRNTDEGSLMMKIKAPAGTRHISVKGALRGQAAFNKNEDEHILARGTSLRVDKIEEWPGEGTQQPHRLLHCTIVRQDG